MRLNPLSSLIAPTLLSLLAGCAMESSETGGGSGEQTVADEDLVKPEEGKADSSVQAVIVDFEWEGEAVVDSTWNVERTIEDQLLYTIGHLNGEKSVGRLDKLELRDVRTIEVDGKKKITYHAKMPVAWGKKHSVPTTYTLRIPRDASFAGYEHFTSKYKDDCVDWSAHDVTSGSMWYYYRPFASGCRLDDADVYTAEATVKVSTVNTTGKYPEYHKVWEDGLFKTVAIFGKYEDGATSSSDAGIAAYNEFIAAAKAKLEPYGVSSVPATLPTQPGVGTPDIELHAKLPDGKKVEIYALLVDNVRTAGPVFDDRYEALSSTADFIVYNGHAGLGANIRALAQKGKWVKGQYAIFFENGCDTYAYVDAEIWQDHAAVNPDDPVGTRYVDMVVNAMPAYFRSDAEATMAFVNGLLAYEQPRTYEQIFKDVDPSQVILVIGEEDNTFVPGGGGGGNPVPAWPGMTQSGSIAKGQEQRFETPKLAKGSYRFEMTGTGDADLYVRVGQAPTTQVYDCRPYKAGSKETCTVSLNTEAPIHVMVRGWASQSTFKLVGRTQ